MKKQMVIFLVLIICAAMVGSSTLVIVVHMPYIAHTSQVLQAEAERSDEPNSAVDVKAEPGQANENSTVLAMKSSSVPSSTEFTPAEKQQIAEMLNHLGIQGEDVSADAIKTFQSQNSLNPTGNLDTSTLNEIIRQLALVKAQAAAVGT